MSSTDNNKETVRPSPIIFTSLVKKLSRKLRLWQQRILTLNSEGELYINRFEKKNPGIVLIASSSPQQPRDKQKSPVINITEQGTLVSQGKRSEVGWPTKLDLRQTLVLSSTSKTYVFLPSVRATEFLKTQLKILQMRQESEKKCDETDSDSDSGSDIEQSGEVKLRRHVSESVLSLSDIDSSPPDGKNNWCDEVISREWKDMELTLLTGLERQKSFSLLSLVEFTDVIKSSFPQSDAAKDEDNDDKTTKQRSSSMKSAREKSGQSKEVYPLEMCLDFTSGPGYLACNRNSIVTDNSVIRNGRDSLLFRPSTQFRPRPILKQRSLYVGEKKESETRVRFNACPSVRIISSVDSDASENVERDHDLLSHYIYKYVVNSHKLKSDRFSARKKQA